MILFIIERLTGSNHDALSGMDAQRIEILHIADSDAIVVAISNDLVFDFLPTFQVLFDQNLVCARQCLLCTFFNFFR